MVIKTIDNPPVKNMTGDSIAKKPAKDMAEYSVAKDSKDYYFHNNKRSQAKKPCMRCNKSNCQG